MIFRIYLNQLLPFQFQKLKIWIRKNWKQCLHLTTTLKKNKNSNRQNLITYYEGIKWQSYLRLQYASNYNCGSYSCCCWCKQKWIDEFRQPRYATAQQIFNSAFLNNAIDWYFLRYLCVGALICLFLIMSSQPYVDLSFLQKICVVDVFENRTLESEF